LTLKKYLRGKPPVILCIGSDVVLMDSLAPLIGTLLCDKHNINAFLYGTLKNPITAKDLLFCYKFIKKLHPGRCILSIDAAVGKQNEIGLVKINKDGLYPGLGVNKFFPKIGDYSIMGIVADDSFASASILTVTRLNLIYKMANIIADAIAESVSGKLKVC